ncbi:hypothetical protein ABIB73_005757 [Bradyrhizobium sp. F1.4.3]|uniref:antitoxin Xre/MbcA/ParS toxin-binding domain-containing protein n=1 Tax=Bradyrhizobium sp. F1.4.3 TaxID=3156356 RepID=UPI003397AD4F
MTIEEGSKAVRVAQVDRLAVNVFGDTAKAHSWLRKSKKALRGEAPLAYLRDGGGGAGRRRDAGSDRSRHLGVRHWRIFNFVGLSGAVAHVARSLRRSALPAV